MTDEGWKMNIGDFLLLWKSVLISPIIWMVLLVYILTPGGVTSIKEKKSVKCHYLLSLEG